MKQTHTDGYIRGQWARWISELASVAAPVLMTTCKWRGIDVVHLSLPLKWGKKSLACDWTNLFLPFFIKTIMFPLFKAEAALNIFVLFFLDSVS